MNDKETLEEVLLFPLIIENGMDYLNFTTKIFNNGAKWQQERMYSEEEVIDLINLRTFDLDLAYSKKPIYYLKTKEWFEQFKKK